MPERYLVVTHCLENMVEILDVEDEEYLPHLLKNIIGCYLRISENERIRADLSGYIPWLLVDYKYVNIIRGDPEAFGNLRRLIWLFGSGTGIQENLPVSHPDW
ncbi:cell differentiation protein rcd1 [Gossypium raimondii]|uniref:cell differentiation protein rcd1 n=1 Tax=Gossypium raimondii TaxID=29730 RepID=UPI00227A6B62|nr:cell differentiation protein rcd1 [Gossypium raimondii]